METDSGQSRAAQAIPRIHETQAILGLSTQETAEILGVQPTLLDDWMARGVPETKHASVEELHELALLLDREIMRSRIPSIVRTPDAWLGNRTILEVVAADGTAPLRGYLTRLYAYRE